MKNISFPIVERIEILEIKAKQKVIPEPTFKAPHPIPKETQNTSIEKVPIQFSFTDTNQTNVFNNPIKCDNCDKVFDKKPKKTQQNKKHIDNDQAHCLLCKTQDSLKNHFEAVHKKIVSK